MSTAIAKNFQIGADGTASNNFTWRQPATPDGTVRLANGNTGSTTDLVTVNSSGNVGIGTSSPGVKFHVEAGRSRFTANSEQYAVEIKYNAATNGVFLGSPAADSLGIYTAGGAERARIDSSGNLLIKKTSSGPEVLQIEGGGATQIGLYCSFTTAYGQINFRNPNGVVGQISTSGSSTTYATSSDYRLKHDIQPMTGALATVAALKPVTYKWNADNSESQGFIAHELQEVVPDCVTGEKDAVDADGNPVYQGIDTSFLVATLTAALQELHGTVKKQQALIVQLQADVAALKAA